jgi:hypothetical protein
MWSFCDYSDKYSLSARVLMAVKMSWVDSETLKMVTLPFSETLVTTCKSTWRHKLGYRFKCSSSVTK